MRRISIAAVAAGGVVDIVATNLAMLPFIIHALTTTDLLERPEAEQVAMFTRAFEDSSGLFATALLLGSACSVIGGWVAARMARREHILHGALSGWACVAFGIAGLFGPATTVSAWEHAAYLVLTPTLGALGGAIRARQESRRPPVEPGDEPIAASPSGHPPLTGWARGLLLANRALAALCALLFTGMGLFGLFTGNGQARLGALLIAGFAGLLIALFILAGRALLAGRRRHWLLHLGAATGSLLLILLFTGA